MNLRFLLRSISNPAVKESLDDLPAGICCYWPGGLVKLKNSAMEQLSFALFDVSLLDGAAFWEKLSAGQGNGEYLRRGETPTVRLDGGSVHAFSRSTITFEGRELYEIIASDLSEEYARNAELVEIRAQVAAMVARQRELNHTIDRMVIEREVLAAKTHIHDDLSRALIQTQRYFSDPGGVDADALRALWLESAYLLGNDAPDYWRGGYDYAFETAREFGIEIALTGELPRGETAERLLSAAMIACLSNAFRHAGAATLTVALSKTADAYRAVFTNDGTPPARPIRETGGLADLRRQIERAGGTMDVQSVPRFALTLTIPKEEDPHARKSPAR